MILSCFLYTIFSITLLVLRVRHECRKVEMIKELACKYHCSVAAVICGAFCSFKQPEEFPVIGGGNLPQIIDSMTGAVLF